MSMLFKRIKDWATTITAFRTGDVIAVDGPDGTAKMPYKNLLKNAVGVKIEKTLTYGVSDLIDGMWNVDTEVTVKTAKKGVYDSLQIVSLICWEIPSWTRLANFDFQGKTTLNNITIPAGTNRLQLYMIDGNEGEQVDVGLYSDISLDVSNNKDAVKTLSQFPDDIADADIYVKKDYVKEIKEYYFGFFLNASGQEVSEVNYKTTDYIHVMPNKSYTADFGSGQEFLSNQAICFYDSDKRFISSYYTQTIDRTRTFDTPSGCAFIRFSCNKVNDLDASLKYNSDTHSVVDDLNVCYGNFAITKKGTLVNHDAMGVEKGFFLKGSGEKVAADSYKTTGYVPVIPEGNYTANFGAGREWSTNQAICFYGKEKNFISSYSTNTNDYSRTFTTPKGCFFIRFSSNVVDDTGSTLVYNSDKPYCWSKEYNSYTDEPLHLKLEKMPVYAILGKSHRIYADNLFFERHNDIHCSVANKFHGRNYYEDTPTNASSSLVLSKYKNENSVFDVAVSIKAVQSNSKSGNSTNIMVIGDSFTDMGVYLQFLNSKANAVNYTLNFLGTLGTTIHHEGRSGWSTYEFAHVLNYNNYSNAFYNPETQQFDFGYYLSQSGVTTPEVIVIELGVNDTWNWMHNTTTLENLQLIVGSIHSVDPTIKIVLIGTAVLYAGEDASLFSLARRKRQIEINNSIIDGFAETENVIVQIMSVNFDPVYSFALTNVSPVEGSTESVTKANDTTHPANAGWNAIADMLLATLLSI